MPIGPPGRVEAAPGDDVVMLSVLANGGRRGAPLSDGEERLLDDWAAGRLSKDAPARAAAALVRDNALAAERLLERRLLDLSASAPAPPRIAAPAARLAPPPAPPPGRRPWVSLPWRWPTLAGGLVLASMLAVAGPPLVRDAMRSEAPLQLALVSIADRGALFEPSDIRMRGGERAPVPAAERRFRDLDVPADVLRSLFARPDRPSVAVAREIEALLPPATPRPPSRVLVDAALRTRVEASPGDARLPVRVYDLDDPRAGDLRASLGVAPGMGDRLFLVTLRP